MAVEWIGLQLNGNGMDRTAVQSIPIQLQSNPFHPKSCPVGVEWIGLQSNGNGMDWTTVEWEWNGQDYGDSVNGMPYTKPDTISMPTCHKRTDDICYLGSITRANWEHQIV